MLTLLFLGPHGGAWSLVRVVVVAGGLLIGLLPGFWRVAPILVGATIGLYSGWLFRAILIGDVVGGPGIEIVVAFMIMGTALAARSLGRRGALWRTGLLGAFYGGLAMHIAVTIASSAPWGLRLPQYGAPAVMMGGLAGGAVGAQVARWRSREC